jgi:hypothetical protein
MSSVRQAQARQTAETNHSSELGNNSQVRAPSCGAIIIWKRSRLPRRRCYGCLLDTLGIEAARVFWKGLPDLVSLPCDDLDAQIVELSD